MKAATKRKSRKQDAPENNAQRTTGDRQVVVHKGHTIIAGVIMGKNVAQVYLGERMATKERFQSDSIEAVIEQAKTWVDDKLAASSELRRQPQIATEGEYKDFFVTFPVNRFQKAMLLVHAQQETLTPDELAKAAGYKTTKKALESYGTLGKAIAEALVLTLPESGTGSAPVGLSVLAERLVEGENESWRIHPELAEAIKAWS